MCVWVGVLCVGVGAFCVRVSGSNHKFQLSGIRDQLGVGRWLPYGFYFLKLYGFSGITCAVRSLCILSSVFTNFTVQFSFGILLRL